MPRGHAVGGGHGVLTDHSIPRHPSQVAPASQANWKLQPFLPADAGQRELGLAYAEIAARTGDARQIREALRLLSAAEQDPQMQLRLADLYQRSNDPQRAATLYRSILQKAPASVVALVNLANAYAAAGNLSDAIPLWREALRLQPCQTEAAQNLRTAYQATKQTKELAALAQSQSGCIVE
jgi:tetratricopeptide (TPR) repeat protein